jgi:hypothetical protein
MRKTSWNSVKAFAIELVKKKTKAEQKRSEPSLKVFFSSARDFYGIGCIVFLLCLKLFFALVKRALRSKQAGLRACSMGVDGRSGARARGHRCSTSQGCRIEDRLTGAESVSPFRDNTSTPYIWRPWDLLLEFSGDSSE